MSTQGKRWILSEDTLLHRKELFRQSAGGRKLSRAMKKRWKDPNSNFNMGPHPRLGSSHTLSTRKRISKSRKTRFKSDAEYRAREMEKVRNMAHIRDKEKWRRNLSTSLKGKIPWNKGLTKETDLRVAKGANAQRGREPAPNHIGIRYVGKGRSIWLRSGWELAFAFWCDSKGIHWLYEPFRFPLRSGLYYRPDFYLPDYGLLVEIKGRPVKVFMQKLEDFCKEYPRLNILVLRKEELDPSGVLQFNPRNRRCKIKQ